jgi:hypothetical protein
MLPGEPQLETFLEDIVSFPQKNYLWLRLLSYLEYIGYRKMVKALNYQDVQKGVFHHLTDEIRHSFMLRELAEKTPGSESCAHSDLESLQQIGEDYFQALDAEVHDWVSLQTGGENPYLCYLLTSYLIECRAMKVYPLYFSRLNEAPAKYVIQQIIRDESEHLHYLQEKMGFLEELATLQASELQVCERRLFGQLLSELSAHLGAGGAVPPLKQDAQLAAASSHR